MDEQKQRHFAGDSRLVAIGQVPRTLALVESGDGMLWPTDEYIPAIVDHLAPLIRHMRLEAEHRWGPEVIVRVPVLGMVEPTAISQNNLIIRDARRIIEAGDCVTFVEGMEWTHFCLDIKATNPRLWMPWNIHHPPTADRFRVAVHVLPRNGWILERDRAETEPWQAWYPKEDGSNALHPWPPGPGRPV